MLAHSFDSPTSGSSLLQQLGASSGCRRERAAHTPVRKSAQRLVVAPSSAQPAARGRLRLNFPSPAAFRQGTKWLGSTGDPQWMGSPATSPGSCLPAGFPQPAGGTRLPRSLKTGACPRRALSDQNPPDSHRPAARRTQQGGGRREEGLGRQSGDPKGPSQAPQRSAQLKVD